MIRRPAIGEVWVHVDRFDRKDKRVWAVQYRQATPPHRWRYRCVQHVEMDAPTSTRFFGYKQDQVSAAIVATKSRVSFIARGTIAVIEKL